MLNFNKIVDDYRKTYHIFEKYEGKPWNAEANLIELYKQIGEMIDTKRIDIEQYSDEILDTLCQIIRLMDYYEYDVYEAYKISKTLHISTTDKLDIFMAMLSNIGILSKYVMMKEKYYFKSRVNDSKYKITDDKMMECFSLHIKYILELAKEEKIDLNKVSDRTRRKDQESFLWIEKENSNDL